MPLQPHSHSACAVQAWKAFMRDFGSLYSPFRSAVQALAALDALQSLASLAIDPECAALARCEIRAQASVP